MANYERDEIDLAKPTFCEFLFHILYTPRFVGRNNRNQNCNKVFVKIMHGSDTITTSPRQDTIIREEGLERSYKYKYRYKRNILLSRIKTHEGCCGIDLLCPQELPAPLRPRLLDLLAIGRFFVLIGRFIPRAFRSPDTPSPHAVRFAAL